MRALVLVLALLAPGTLTAQEAPPPRPAAEETRPAPRAPEAAEQATKPAEVAGPTPEVGITPEPLPAAAPVRESDFDYSACLLTLSLLGAEYEEQPAIAEPDQPGCGIARPILLTRPLPGIEIPGGAPMRCDTARHLALWLRDFVRPAAAMLPGQPRLVGLEPGSTYQCRATVGAEGGKLSEHALGNAFDIAAFRFADGTRLEVQPRKESGDLPEAFQRAVRGTACLHFTTVLGPGANAAHDNHLHLDIKARKSGWRLCQ